MKDWVFFLTEKIISLQMNHLVQVAQKCQNTITESGVEWISKQDLQKNVNELDSKFN